MHYLDQETKRSREMDVLALHTDYSGVFRIIFLIECKSSKKPWILLSSPDVLSGHNRMFAFAVSSYQARCAMSNHLMELLADLTWFKKAGVTGYSLRQAFSDIDSAYAAAITLAKASASFTPDQESRVWQISLVFPVLVVDSPLVQCMLNAQGHPETKEIEEGEFLFQSDPPEAFSTCIRVITLARLPAFASEAKRIAEYLQKQFTSEIEEALQAIVGE